MAFKWTRRREKAALALAHGYTQAQAAEMAGVTRRTIIRWNNNIEFACEVDRLTLITGIASRAERVRIATRVIRQKIQDDGEFILTNKDLLDWIKFVQSETDGAKLDLTFIFEAMEAAEAARSESDGEASGNRADNQS